MENLIIPTKEIKTAETKSNNALKKAKEFIINNEIDLNEAGKISLELTKFQKFLKSEKEKITKPLNEALKNARDLFRPSEENIDEAKRTIDKKMSDYYLLIEKKKKEDEKKIAARVEKGTLKEETAVKKMEALEEAPKKVESTEGKITFRTDRNFEIENESLIPDEYWQLDLTKIGKVIRAGGEIKGVKVIETKIPIHKLN